MNRLVAWIDRYALAPSLRTGDGDALRRGRLLVTVTLILALPNVAFTGMYAVAGDLRQMLPSALIGLFYLAGLLAVRTRGNLTAATHLMVAPLILFVLGMAFATGGILSISTWSWAMLGVMMAFLLGGARVGRIWAAIHLVAVGLAIGQVTFGTPVLPPIVTADDAVLASFSVVFLSSTLIGIAITYERLKDHMLASLREASARSRLVLDNIGDGFLLVRADGTLTAERSTAAEHWFGPVTPDAHVWDYLVQDEDDQLRLMLGWEELVADVMPRELLLEQMPKRTTRGLRTWSLHYRVVGEARIEAVVVVVRDITHTLAAMRAEEERAEQMQLFELVARDAGGFRAFLRESGHQIASLVGAEATLQRRTLHTLKGNAAQVGARSVASFCHQLEERLASGDELVRGDAEELARRLEAIQRRFAPLLGEVHQVQLDEADVAAVRTAIRRRAPPAELEALVDGWSGESMNQRLNRIADQAQALATRLGRNQVEVSVAAAAVRYPAGRLDELFAAFSHLIRNAVDHGIEAPEQRVRAGKAPVGSLRVTAACTDGALIFTVMDDGRGVDWGAVRERALSRGLPVGGDLADLLFLDGFTTRDAADEISGRGIGMSAVRQAAQRLGGVVRLESTPGIGTAVTIAVPAAAVFGAAAPIEWHASAAEA